MGFPMEKHFLMGPFELHRGEILGIAGLEGSGKSEVIRAILEKHYSSGTIGKSTIKHIPTASILLWNRGTFVPARRRKVEEDYFKTGYCLEYYHCFFAN